MPPYRLPSAPRRPPPPRPIALPGLAPLELRYDRDGPAVACGVCGALTRPGPGYAGVYAALRVMRTKHMGCGRG